ncbi:dienelactone hydrolase family protein [Roseomonas sp. PWR1]|uniref:Dienelactone hydrolase family protein n=1 Tax=Roseomonas nitratireducens TaxID=2820810 RepID=A0ABS4B139_9PROT|nr:dienelactone hydrolase family protein [Neoroseomonas nitratireducens]MBP0466751.1 dienelactone hydrolase family protein [Neoroseomonas nitratireducens]
MAITAAAIDIPAPGGTINAHLYAPDDAPEAAPAILLLMDAPGLRPALHGMAARLAACGYRALLPNLYWRRLREVGFDRAAFSREGDPERERIFTLARGYGHAEFRTDLPAMLDALGVTQARPAGALGYCMSGRFALQALAEQPGRVAAAASFYGTRMVTEAADSPHLWLPALARGEAYLCFAEHDPYVPAGVPETVAEAIGRSRLPHRIEHYPGTHHGFAQPDSGGFDPVAAERHWAALLALFARLPR